MRFEDIQKILKGANQLRKMKLYPRKTTGDNVVIWVYCDYERKSLGLPPLKISDRNTKPEEAALLRKAIELRDRKEAEGDNSAMSAADSKEKSSNVMQKWVEHYVTESGMQNARGAKDKFLAICGDIAVGTISRRHFIKVIDVMKQKGYNVNYIRDTASRLRAFCNYAEQRGYMSRVDTRKLLPPEQFGEVKALGEDELRMLAAAPCEACPDVKDLFMLGVYTAQRIGEIKLYTFSAFYDGQIKARQGKTGKFIVIPLSENALDIMKNLKKRREKEGKPTSAKDKIFDLPSKQKTYKIFHAWVEAAGIERGRITLHNSRSTAISLLINRGVPESVTQELANHSSPTTTARYYRQIDDSKKKEALAKIPKF